MSPPNLSTAEVVAFEDPRLDDQREALLAALGPLHTLITLDPVLGASPVRVYFVLNPQARRRIVECVDPAERPLARRAPAFALVAYDFPFAMHLVEGAGVEGSGVEGAGQQAGSDGAREIITRSAGLQGDSLRAAAGAFGIDAEPVLAFDAAALKSTFFPNTQETVTHVVRLALNPGRGGSGQGARPAAPRHPSNQGVPTDV